MEKKKTTDIVLIVPYSCRISKRQEEKIKFFEEFGLIKSNIGTLGIEIVLQALDEIYRDWGSNPEKFKQKVNKPPMLYELDLLIKNLPLNEQVVIKLFKNSHHRGERRLK